MSGQDAGSQRDGGPPSQEFWEDHGFEDTTFMPDFSFTGIDALNEHDRMMTSLLYSAPDSVFLPPINVIPTSRLDVLDLFYQVCLNLFSFEAPERASLVRRGENFTLNHLFLALAVFRYPDNVGYPDDVNDIASNLAMILQRMLADFWAWTRTWQPSDVRSRLFSHDPSLLIVELTTQALIELTARQDICDGESKWLFAMLSVIGFVPEIWGIGETFSSSPSGQGPSLPPQVTSVHPGSGDRAAHLRQHRGGSVSRVSVSSVSSRSSTSQDPLILMGRIHELHSVNRIELHRIMLSAHEGALMTKVSDNFYRSILIQYSHFFNRAQMSERYNNLILRNPTIMARVVVRCYEHMLRDLKILCGENAD